MRRTAPLLALALLSAPVLAQADPPVTRFHDLRALEMLSWPGDVGVDLRPILQSSNLDELETDRGDAPPVPLEAGLEADLDTWIGWLADTLDAAGVEEPFELDPVAGLLRVTASEAVQGRVSTLLDELETNLLRPIELEAYVLPPAAARAAEPVLDAATVTALLSEHPPLEAARTRAPVGRRARLQFQRWHASLYDFDVEVATQTTVSDPSVTRVIDGLDVGAVPLPLHDGKVFLRAWARAGDLADETREIRVDDQRDLSVQLLRAESTLVVGSAVLEPGGGLLLGHDRRPGGLLLLRVPPVTLPADSPFVPVGALLAPPLVADMPHVYGLEPTGGIFPRDPLDEFDGALHRLFFEDAWHLEDHLRATLDRDGLFPRLRVLGPLVHVPDPAARERVRAEVAAWHEAALRTVSVELRLGPVDPALAREAAPAELLPHLPWSATGSCRLGDMLMIVGGEERNYVLDYDMEVAEKAANADPIVEQQFEGFTFRCRPAATRAGRITAWTDLLVLHTLPPSDPATIAWETGTRQEDEPPVITRGDLELPTSARVASRGTVSLEAGEWTLLTLGELQGTGKTLAAVIRSRTP